MSSFFAPKQDVNPCEKGSGDLIKRINFDDFLKDEGVFDEVKALAQKELVVEGSLESDNASEVPKGSSNASQGLSDGCDTSSISKYNPRDLYIVNTIAANTIPSNPMLSRTRCRWETIVSIPCN